MKSLFLYPGQLAHSSEPATITTMLGSCVGVALFDQRLKSGGLNHYLLPAPVGEEKSTPRYGPFAMQELLDSFLRAGSSKRDLVAKVYGGASVLDKVSIGQKIGERNIEVALNFLAEHGIPVIEKNVGGTRGRKISLTTQTHEVQHYLTGEDNGAPVDVSGFSALKEAQEVKVVIVDDSATVRSIFEKIFSRHGLKVVGVASNPFEAREVIVREQPDVITLDIEMPQMNGVQFLEKLMKHMPLPVVMVSSLGSTGEAAMESLRLGAVEFVQKPSQFDPEILRGLATTLVTKVRAAATVNVLKARPTASAPPRQASAVLSGFKAKAALAGVFVSGNTAAPRSITRLLTKFTGDTPPVVFSVSTLNAFLPSFIADHKGKTGLSLQIAKDGEQLFNGKGYFIPENVHGKIVSRGGSLFLNLVKGQPVHGQLPSGDILLSSAAEAIGSAAAGVLLSGFGTDGVAGLEQIYNKGGFAMVENPQSAGFPFVPQTAIGNGIVHQIAEPEEFFDLLMAHRNKRVA